MRFAIASEGKTDYVVLKNLLYGFFKDKNLPVTPLRPKDREPFGWGNLLNYIATSDFREDCEDENIDCVIVQIDTNECEQWAGIKHLGDDAAEINSFIEQIVAALVARIGSEFYETNKLKIIFAVCVHEIECWLLPFNTQSKAHKAKLVGCYNTLDKVARKKGFSLDEKNYRDGKHYDDLSKEMKDNRELLRKSELNPGLKYFIQVLDKTLSNEAEQ